MSTTKAWLKNVLKSFEGDTEKSVNSLYIFSKKKKKLQNFADYLMIGSTTEPINLDY